MRLERLFSALPHTPCRCNVMGFLAMCIDFYVFISSSSSSSSWL